MIRSVEVQDQFLFAPRFLPPALAAARADQRGGLGHAVAAQDTSDGGWIDRSHMDLTGGAAVPRAAVAAASEKVSRKGRGGIDRSQQAAGPSRLDDLQSWVKET